MPDNVITDTKTAEERAEECINKIFERKDDWVNDSDGFHVDWWLVEVLREEIPKVFKAHAKSERR